MGNEIGESYEFECLSHWHGHRARAFVWNLNTTDGVWWEANNICIVNEANSMLNYGLDYYYYIVILI